MIDPLSLWKSDEVTSLLIDFYEANFKKAGIPDGHGEKIILTAFENKNLLAKADLQSKLNSLFLEAKTNLSKSTSEANQLSLIDFSNVKSFVDIGANRLDTINKIGRFFPQIEELIGLDVIPLNGVPKYVEKTKYFQINPQDSQYPIKEKSVDTINFQYTLHHFENDEMIVDSLQKCKKILRENGRIIIWEESFEESIDIETIVDKNQKLGFFTDKILTERFYTLNKEQRWEFIIVNDWLININNKHMQWTGMYKMWEEWVHLFEASGFSIKKKTNLGLRISGHVKTGVHIVGEFILSFI